MKNDNQLTTEEMDFLRKTTLLKDDEFAYRAGDLIIAENPATGNKRIITRAHMLHESNRRILKG